MDGRHAAEKNNDNDKKQMSGSGAALVPAALPKRASKATNQPTYLVGIGK
jgi:hypothetical protein